MAEQENSCKTPIKKLRDELASEVNKWIEDAKSEFFSDNLAINEDFAGNNRIQQLVGVLRELVLNHKWKHVPDVTACLLSNERAGHAIEGSIQGTIHSLSVESVLQTMPADKTDRLADVTKRLGSMLKMESHVALMTYFLHQIYCGHEDEAKHAQDLPQMSYKRKSYQSDLKHLMKAYKGLLSFMEWSDLKMKIKSLEKDAVYLQQAGSADDLLMEKHNLETIGKMALEQMMAVQGHPQVWDIFVSKQIEILEHHGYTEEAEKLLETYRTEQPDNLYALMSVYRFYKRNKRSKELRIQVLEDIMRLAPFDEVALDLYKLYKSREKKASKKLASSCYSESNDSTTEADDVDMMSSVTSWREKSICLLFRLLDYPQWKDNHEVWCLLAEELEQSINSSDNTGEADALWEERRSWWPDYCFTGLHNNTIETMYWKTVCASMLLGPDNEQVQCMRNQCMEHRQFKSYEKSLNLTVKLKRRIPRIRRQTEN